MAIVLALKEPLPLASLSALIGKEVNLRPIIKPHRRSNCASNPDTQYLEIPVPWSSSVTYQAAADTARRCSSPTMLNQLT